ncbi:phospholipid carrier-dependent glycosyltransferase [Candidatus Gottesmanbacteria bacterium]|nr:phospholipid carrier-dependent glycosyltransferase [Candidatus Gottesmanbacteria bacterium]
MGNAISQLRLPNDLSQIPICLISQISPKNDPGSSSGSNDPGSSVTNNCNLNPHFFAYGQFPLYLAYFSDQTSSVILNSFQHLIGIPKQVRDDTFATSFPSAIFWLRFYSALASVLTVLLIYLISQSLIHNSKFSILAALMAAFSPGLIQSAHFGTTESLLTFFFLASIYLSIVILRPKAEESRTNVRKQVAGSFASLRMTKEWKYLLLLSLVIGLAAGSKLTGLFFFIPPLTALIICINRATKKRGGKWLSGLLGYWVIGLFLIISSIIFFIASSPYNLIDFPDFKSAVFGYEADVATGKYPAFYTKQFVDTIPIIFQVKKIFPYALGWPVFILGSIGIVLMTLKLLLKLILSIIQKVQSSKFKVQKLRIRKYLDFDNLDLIGILILGFWIYFIPNAFLFAKWTRFMTPVLPLFAIFAGYFLSTLLSSRPSLRDLSQLRDFISDKLRDSSTSLRFARNDKIGKLGYWVIGLLVFISVLPGIAFISIYAHEDTRVTASKWIYQNIPNNSYILSETANVVDIPLGLTSPLKSPLLEGEGKGEVYKNNYTVISFDFYHLDKNQTLYNELINHLEKADYIFIPSRRIFINYMRLPKTYPLVTKYYQLLFSGALGFEKVTEITSFPQLSLSSPGRWPNGLLPGVRWEFPDENAEETFTVFDHPVIRIYRKVRPLTKEEYRKLFD